MKIAIVISEFNNNICEGLLKGAMQAFDEEKFPIQNVKTFKVPGAFEIPFMCQKLAYTKEFSGIIALGCVLKGETDHYQAVCEGVTHGIQKVSIENRIPIMFGVLMCQDITQARSRSQINKKNKGHECAKSMLKILKER